MKRYRKLIVFVTMIIAIFIIAPKSNSAGLSISFSKSSANVGDKVSVSVNGSGIAGKIALSTSGNATISPSSVWVDNSTASATVTITGNGNVTVTATPSDVSDSTTAEPYKTATAGTIKVSSSDKTNNDSNTPASKSSVATLANLGIKPNDFKGFSPNKFSYSVEVPYETASIEVYATKGQSGQTITGTGKKDLKEGANTFNITVTAEDGKTKKTYTINVTRKAKGEEVEQEQEEKQEENTEENQGEANFGLSTLKIKGIELNPTFQTEIYEYNIEIKDNLDKLEIENVPTEEDATVEILGNENLREGENIITINVKDKTGEKLITYQITANKIYEQEQLKLEEQNQKQKMIIIGSCAAVGAIILIIIIVVIVKKVKSKSSASENYQNIKDVFNYDKEVDLDDEPEVEEKPKKKRHSKGKRFK